MTSLASLEPLSHHHSLPGIITASLASPKHPLHHHSLLRIITASRASLQPHSGHHSLPSHHYCPLRITAASINPPSHHHHQPPLVLDCLPRVTTTSLAPSRLSSHHHSFPHISKAPFASSPPPSHHHSLPRITTARLPSPQQDRATKSAPEKHHAQRAPLNKFTHEGRL
jgi:hypothetical protein